jgi:hypothetical protein
MYCGDRASEMFVVLKARGPKGTPNRWARIGHCCDKCEAAGKPIRIP